MRIRSKYLDEKLTAADPTSKWISDFITSDNPRFANKSVKERINMALGASYAAKGQSANEETVRDPVMAFASKAHEEWRSGWRKQNNGNSLPRVKNNSDGSEGDINVPFNKLHPDWQKENLAAGNAAKDAVTKHPNDIEKAAEHVHNKWMERNPKQDYNAAQHVPYSELPEDEKEKDRVHVRTMQNLMSTNEEIQDSGWNPAKKRKDQYGNPIKPHNVPKRLARQGIPKQPVKDEKGFGPSPADKLSIRKNEEVEELDEISKDALTSYADKSIKDAETRRKQGNAYEKLVPSDPDYAKTFYKKSANRLAGATKAMSRLAKEEVELDEGKYGAFRIGPKRPKYPHVPPGNQDPRTGLPLGFSPPPNKDEPKNKKVKEEVELDELDQKTLSNYATRAKFSSDPRRRIGAAKAQEKINKKSKDMQKEEAEQVDEALRHKIAGAVAAFLGNKIDPLHGQIMQKHGEEAYRQAATHIRRVAGEVHDAVSALHDRLHKHLRTGGLATEEVELDESHFKVGDKVKCKASGMKGEVVKLDKEEGGDTEKYYTVKREDGTTKKMAPKDMTKINEETDQIDEVSAGLAKSVAQRRDQDFRKMTPTETQKRRMSRGDWQADPSLQADKAYKSAVKRGAKDVYGYNEESELEETELEEDGKLKGGAKDPCWTGYKMVGTKKKGGREVPNCVPREGTEQNTFKALREKLNGNSNRS